MMSVLLNIYIISFDIAVICYTLTRIGFIDWIMNKIFGELDDDGFDELVNDISEQFGVDFDEFLDNIDADYTDFLMLLSIIVCPPFFIAFFIDYIYRIIKFRKK